MPDVNAFKLIYTVIENKWRELSEKLWAGLGSGSPKQRHNTKIIIKTPDLDKHSDLNVAVLLENWTGLPGNNSQTSTGGEKPKPTL